MTRRRLWEWLRDENNQGALKVLGGILVAVVGGTWVIFIYLNPSPPPQTPPLPNALGSFYITVKNNSHQALRVSGAEYYIQSPVSPGVNQTVKSGIVEFEGDVFYSFQVQPMRTEVVSALLKNESATLPLLDAGNSFILIILISEPKPVRSEVVFSRQVLLHGMEFVYDG